jgi:hypothetical protein
MNWTHVMEELVTNPSIAKYSDEERQGMHLLHLVCALRPPLQVVRFNIEAFPQGRYTKSSTAGVIPLMIACGRNASPKVIEELLVGATDTIAITDSTGFSAIHWACREDVSFAVVKQLLVVDPTIASFANSILNEPLDIILPGENSQRLSINQGTKFSLILRARYYNNIQLDPQANSVLHAALALQYPSRVLEFSLQQVVMTKVNDKSIASHRDCFGNLPLHYAVQLKLSKKNHVVDIMFFRTFLPRVSVLFPEGAGLCDHVGRLPLHEALKNGYTWFRGIQVLFESYPLANTILDPTYKLYPFCLAAVFSNTDKLETCYSLLRENPELIVG